MSNLGRRSRLGNHLFQYAVLRSQAQRMGVKFYCPKWAGDDIFDLNDSNERLFDLNEIKFIFNEPINHTGYNSSLLGISDGTDINGYFQTERYFDKHKVYEWYSFKNEIVFNMRKKFASIDFSNSCGLHVRLGDFVDTYNNLYYVPNLSYYKKALKLIEDCEKIIVFSDDICGAKKFLSGLDSRLFFIDGYEAAEGIYLQSQCRDFICSSSTYGWWGAWLNKNLKKKIIVPAEGPFRPCSPIKNNDFWPDDWIKISGLNFYLDNYYSIKIKNLFIRANNKIRKILY